MKLISIIILVVFLQPSIVKCQTSESWIRINQLGYAANGNKVAVLASKALIAVNKFEIVDSVSNKTVFSGTIGSSFGAYGPFNDTYRIDFSAFRKSGNYIIKVGNTASPVFRINKNVYDGAADFCLKYMRQQRSGFNPYLKDSCHTYDGYTLFAPVPDSTHIDAVGGWHDATDYLQYSTTTANATFHLLAAYRDFPKVFTDKKNESGLDGSNKIADVMDEARWGLNWLMKMHPKKGWLFNQLGDDRDHSGMRLPKLDSAYGRGYERPVYFCNGKPQMRQKFMNNTTGAASTAGKFAAAFALGSQMFMFDRPFAEKLKEKSGTAIQIGKDMPGVAQTASVMAPYIYAEDNWKDDMELGYATLYNINHNAGDLDSAFKMASDEPITPWLGGDTAFHYQWYPFINVGHYELAKALKDERRDSVISYYKQGIEKVWSKAKQNAFYRGVPYIWCSNNLTVSLAIQCYWYRKLTNDNTYIEMERACFDWIFGCNPWGTSMVYGFPTWGDTPVDPHSSFTHVAGYPIDGGLVDGPLYTATYRKQLGLQLAHDDEYAQFQSELAVYHDDVGDYSTNEPTMDGTASLIYLLAAMEAESKK